MITQKYSSNGEVYYLKIMITSKYNLEQFKSLIIKKKPKTIVLESDDSWLNPKTMLFANILLENNYKPHEIKFLNERNPKDKYLLKIILTINKITTQHDNSINHFKSICHASHIRNKAWSK